MSQFFRQGPAVGFNYHNDEKYVCLGAYGLDCDLNRGAARRGEILVERQEAIALARALMPVLDESEQGNAEVVIEIMERL